MCVALGSRADWAPCQMPEVRRLQSDTGAVLTHLVLAVIKIEQLSQVQISLQKATCRAVVWLGRFSSIVLRCGITHLDMHG